VIGDIDESRRACVFVHSLDRKVFSLITRHDTDDVSISAIKLERRLGYDE
jgi:hypothetical protein